MKKTIVTCLVAALSSVTMLKAQSIQEGMNHLYADRYKSAIGVFEKMLAADPNNTAATYWLGQVYFDMDDNAKARQLYQAAMQKSGSDPYILVGMGHVDLMENKANDARQKFEAALTASRGKKGDDPLIQSAIGRAIADSKTGDFKWAVQLLEAATSKDPKNTEAWIQLGNNYRKADPGNGGGLAFQAYKKALEANPAFAVADLRLAKIFESQKNYERVLEYLNSAAQRDPRFAPAYYELFYYYFFRTQYPEAEAQLNKYVANTDQSWETEYLQAQLFWAKKDYATAVTKAEAVAATNGAATKPRVYRLLADAYFSKGDFTNAKRTSDIFFSKEKPEEVTLYDLQLRAEILAKTGGTDEEILNTYLSAAKLDTTAGLKIDLLKKGAASYKEQKKRSYESVLISKVIDLRAKPSLVDYFDITMASYFTPDYVKAREWAVKMRDTFPDQMYGYEWSVNASRILDSVKKDSIYVPDLLLMETFANTDTVKYKKQLLSSFRSLADYYYNTARDKDKSLEYFNKWLVIDTANAETIKKYIDMAERLSAPRPSSNAPSTPKTPPAQTGGTQPRAATTTKPAGTTTAKAAGTSTKPAATTTKKAAPKSTAEKK